MNWRLKLRINPMCVKLGKGPDGEEREPVPSVQFSPLVFAGPIEAQCFAHNMFEPPESVISWELESTRLPVNFKYSKEVKL